MTDPPHRLLGSDLAADPAFLLARARAVTSGVANARLAGFQLKVRSLSVLWLASQGFGPSQRELSDFLGLDPSQVVALVDDLQGRGLVERRPDERDRRSRIIVATEAGLELLEQALVEIRAAGDSTFAGLTDDERKTLTGLLTKVAFGGRAAEG
ncbi:MarR family transcriptional regulator [Actinoplanes sichuanensis]|uniref:MarR family winged helix-turn-helix transcriptional regulator n=1 Tax=Actinoplanes sichuanensis TaxID=512349 RepID=A0ABW4A910_9ACTN|nr:MarR family winged helix-turn-helix transcriptional regulator [Actinoplanes sichuanensis]BEL03664.1 MarR family transcriptional regulator [Actinoplanes sichuanensis]